MRKALVSLFLLIGLAWASVAHAQVVPSATDTIVRLSSGTATTQTFSGVQFGSAFASRVIVAFISVDSGTLPTITMGGIPATLFGIIADGVYIASAVIPTGTSGNIVAVGTGMTGGACIGVYSLSGATGATQFDSKISPTGNSVAINSPANGAIVAAAISVTTVGTWTGATQDWLDTSSGSAVSGASFANSSAVTARTVSYSTAANVLAASFSPSGSPPPATLHMMPLLGVGK